MVLKLVPPNNLSLARSVHNKDKKETPGAPGVSFLGKKKPRLFLKPELDFFVLPFFPYGPIEPNTLQTVLRLGQYYPTVFGANPV